MEAETSERAPEGVEGTGLATPVFLRSVVDFSDYVYVNMVYCVRSESILKVSLWVAMGELTKVEVGYLSEEEANQVRERIPAATSGPNRTTDLLVDQKVFTDALRQAQEFVIFSASSALLDLGAARI